MDWKSVPSCPLPTAHYQHRGVGEDQAPVSASCVGCLSFGDMLGDQDVQSALQVGKSRVDFADQVNYRKMRARWYWGVLTSQVPWVTGSTITHGTIVDPSQWRSLPPEPRRAIVLYDLAPK